MAVGRRAASDPEVPQGTDAAADARGAPHGRGALPLARRSRVFVLKSADQAAAGRGRAAAVGAGVGGALRRAEFALPPRPTTASAGVLRRRGVR